MTLMGTNYYLHIGKVVAQEQGKPPRFIWAMNFSTGGDNSPAAPDVTVEDESGNSMTFLAFLEMITAYDQDLTCVGEGFR
jgi:hypothetical protein